MPDGFQLHGEWYDPALPQEPWEPLVQRVAQLLQAGATARACGPDVQIDLKGAPFVLTDQAVYAAACSRLADVRR
jgi:hypothetical protein